MCAAWRSCGAPANWSPAADLQRRLVAPNAAVTRQLGVPGLKAAMDGRGLYGGPVRPPLLPLSHKQTEALAQVFVDAGF